MNRHSQPRRILIVADDLTGACDAAAPFAHHGRRTSVTCDLVQHKTSAPDVLSICTQSRADEASVAASKVARVCTSWGHDPDAYFIKKIDSTLKGNIAWETAAMLRSLPAEIAIVAPAFPEQGRTFQNGILHINGTAERAMNLPEMLKKQTNLDVREIRRDDLRVLSADCRNAVSQATVDEKKQIWVVDAHGPVDMDCVAEIIAQLGPRAIAVGSSGITHRLAQKWTRGQSGHVSTNTSVNAFVVIAGSRQPATTGQIQHFIRTRGAACVSIESAADLDAISPGGLRSSVSGLPSIVIQIPSEISQHHALMELPNRLNAIGPVRLLLTGGDTAQWLFDASEAESIAVVGEVEVGIPCGQIRGGKLNGFPVITKAGGFGTLGTLTDVYDRFNDAA